MRTSRTRKNPVDVAVAHLARLVVEETWTVHEAAALATLDAALSYDAAPPGPSRSTSSGPS